MGGSSSVVFLTCVADLGGTSGPDLKLNNILQITDNEVIPDTCFQS